MTLVRFEKDRVNMDLIQADGGVVSFGVGKNWRTGEKIYKTLITVRPRTQAEFLAWQKWTMFGKRVEGFGDSLGVFKEDGTLDVDRNFLYAPYGGMKLSWRTIQARIIADSKEQWSEFRDSFEDYNDMHGKFTLKFEGESRNGPYAVYTS